MKGALVRVGAAAKMFQREATDLVFPPICPLCEREHSQSLDDGSPSLCADCWPRVRLLSGPGCERCGLPFSHSDVEVLGPQAQCVACLTVPPPFARMRCALGYSDASRTLIVKFKHLDQPELSRLFGRWLAISGKDLLDRADVVVPIPLHWRRRFAREYNQSALLAREAINAHGRFGRAKPTLRPDLLVRSRATRSMGRLSRRERRANVRQAFTVPPPRRAELAGKSVLLVDDVYASGATIAAAINALKSTGAAELSVLILARSLDDITSYSLPGSEKVRGFF